MSADESHREATTTPDTLAGLRCLRCKYDLTGLREYRCPECGTRFSPAALRQRKANGEPTLTLVAKWLLGVGLALTAFQIVAEIYVVHILNPALWQKEQSLWGYQGDFITHAGQSVPCFIHPLLFICSLILCFHAALKNEPRPAMIALCAFVVSFVGMLLLVAFLLHFGD